MSRVIVGVDGSEASGVALEFALEEARLREAVLEVVHIYPPLPLEAELGPRRSGTVLLAGRLGRVELPDDLLEEAEAAAEELVSRLLDEVGETRVTVRSVVIADRRPARRLVAYAGGADVDMLVVGSRGRGELTGQLMGSVTRACVAHARVPVTVVRRPT